jgi:hypothetical protein
MNWKAIMMRLVISVRSTDYCFFVEDVVAQHMLLTNKCGFTDSALTTCENYVRNHSGRTLIKMTL